MSSVPCPMSKPGKSNGKISSAQSCPLTHGKGLFNNGGSNVKPNKNSPTLSASVKQ